VLSSGAPMPSGLVHPAFAAVPLSPANVHLDFAAYMASPAVIRVHSDGRWPIDGFTLEDDESQAAAHYAAHQARRAFTFLLLDPSRSQSLKAFSGWLATDWPLARCLFRILPGERSSRRALERLQLRPVELLLPDEARPYLWFQIR
jgi:hypothetical protein